MSPCALLFAQTGGVKGRVVDAESGEALIGVTVIIENTTKGSIADLDGNYTITKVPVGDQTVVVSYVGYEETKVDVTIKEGEITEVALVDLNSASIGLQEVEIFASVVDDRKTPVAVSSITAEQIAERYEGMSIAEMTSNTAGVYSIQGTGGYGDNEVYIRGFDQTNIAFLVNGIPVNDMENGRMFWSNFAGLSEVTRQVQVQRGLGASKLAISSIGGTVNMITKPADKQEGGKVEYQTGTGSWNQRLRFSYNTGVLTGGWAVSFQGSRTTTNGGFSGLPGTESGGVVPGAFTDAWSYYLSVSKTISKRHQIMFWGFGAPVNRGTAWVADEAVREEFGIQDNNSNNALGIYRGDLFNARQNKTHKPTMALSHFWDIDDETSLNTSVYASIASVYSTQPRDADNSLFFPSTQEGAFPARNVNNPAFTRDNMINWDYLAAQNRDASRLRTVEFPNGDINTPSLEGYASRFYLESRHNNHEWIGVISNFKKTINKLSLLAGIDYRHYKGIHYAEAFELFDGDFVLNQSSFGDDFNRLAPNGVARQGDRINYDYDGYVDWGAVFAQAEYHLDKFDIFATGTFTNTRYQRVGKFWNGRDIHELNSLGESGTKSFNTYTAKTGVNFRPTNRHNIYANIGRFTRPPFFRNAFSDARYSNEFREGLTTEKITTGELGYGYRSGALKVNVNAYYTLWKDRTTTFEANNTDFQNLGDGEELPLVLNGLESVHQGLELDLTYNVTSTLEINGFLSYGDWKWDNSPTTTVTVSNELGTQSQEFTIPLKGLPVGTTAQTTAGLGFHYRGIKDMYVGGRWNYSDRIAIRFSPEDLIEGFITRDVIEDGISDFSTFQVYAGRYFKFSDNVQGRLSASVQNLFNTEYVRWASYFFSQQQLAYGFPRTYTIGFSIEF